MYEERNTEKDKKERKYIIAFCIIAALYLIVCIVIYVWADIAEKDAYVKVSPLTLSPDDPVIHESEKIDINSASREELMTLNGIGEVTAGKIIEYRDTYGGFLYIEELLNVNGIGEKTLRSIRPYIWVGPCSSASAAETVTVS